MPEIPLNLTEIEGRITVLRENIRQLVEQAAAFSGAADEELVSQRIAEQEAQLELLTRQRDGLFNKNRDRAFSGMSAIVIKCTSKACRQMSTFGACCGLHFIRNALIANGTKLA